MASTDCSTVLVWDEGLSAYNFGPSHPLSPVRVQLAIELIEEIGVGELITWLREFAPADDDEIATVHDRDYVAAVKAASEEARPDPARGLGTIDDPIFPGMHAASALVCGATLAAAQAVWQGSASHAVNLAGGLHHAMPDRASGFCIYNDIAIAIAWLLDAGVERIAYVDLDVHHGDGVQRIFWNDPRVLTISVHEDPLRLFPGTGFPRETGGEAATGTCVNLALPVGTADEDWLHSVGTISDRLSRFQPEVLFTQNGVDTHRNDPLAHFKVTVDGHNAAFALTHQWAHDFANGRLVAVGGGGYDVADAVPRSWAGLVGQIAGSPLDAATLIPEKFRRRVLDRTGRAMSTHLGDERR